MGAGEREGERERERERERETVCRGLERDLGSRREREREGERERETLGTVFSKPARVALARSIDGVAGTVVGAHTHLSTLLPKPATWTH